jgi:hypothetical protein
VPTQDLTQLLIVIAVADSRWCDLRLLFQESFRQLRELVRRCVSTSLMNDAVDEPLLLVAEEQSLEEVLRLDDLMPVVLGNLRSHHHSLPRLLREILLADALLVSVSTFFAAARGRFSSDGRAFVAERRSTLVVPMKNGKKNGKK